MTSGPTRTRCDRTAAWQALAAHHAAAGEGFDLRAAFAADSQRFDRFSFEAPHVFVDASKSLLDAKALDLLLDLAQQCGVAQHRDAMFAGETVNTTEHRSAMHFLLRNPTQPFVDSLKSPDEQVATSWRQAQQALTAMLAFAESVRKDSAITDVVSIGIGGSDLGPQMVTLALDDFAVVGKRFHFVSNVDGHELAAVLRQVRPHSTVFVLASKSFTTVETLTNGLSARQWFEAQGGTDVARHFVAVTTNVDAAKAFGIHTTFAFWDWVGGRYSLWSAIGLSIAIAIGRDGFLALLEGAHAMDEHFRTAPMARNLPVVLGLLDVWYRNFHGFSSRSIAPYHSGLRRLPAYLQQLEMESNGKRVDLQGEPLAYQTAPVLWGEPGTNGQHAYFQMLHQGTEVIPVEFIAVRQPGRSLPGHHALLLANVLAQAQALMQGRDHAGGHRHFPGNRPSLFVLLDTLTPRSLGALIAMHEHRVFVSGSVWGINSFDQWGVELGKVLAKDLTARLTTGDTTGLDASTAGLLQRLR
jgi:glucose-6-phosphate isomerase